MKYIYYIVIIVLLFSAAAASFLFRKPNNHKDAAIIVNDKTITKEEYLKLTKSPSQYFTTKKDLINSLITKEVLIGEAQKSGIDKENQFVDSIKNYYEQSLIKLLMDRKFSTLDIKISESDIDKYQNLTDKRLHLTRFEVTTPEAGIDARGGEELVLSFCDLSQEIRIELCKLQPGEMTAPLRQEAGLMVYRLDGLEDDPNPSSPITRDEIRQILREHRTEQAINEWVTGLVEKARIQILIPEQ